MKNKITTLLFILLVGTLCNAQSVDEILNNYFENTGGAENWEALKGIEMKASVNSQGMEIPLTILQLSGGQQIVKFELQGNEVTQLAFDGETAWGQNFMTMEAEKSDDEATENLKRDIGDFPSPFLDYKTKGFSVELIGEETIEGAECFKVKLTKKSKLVDGKEEDNISFYFFDKENFVPIVVEEEIKTGEMKGSISQTILSDYDEIDGLYFPFSMTQGIKGMGGQTIKIGAINLNPEVSMDVFKFPGE